MYGEREAQPKHLSPLRDIFWSTPRCGDPRLALRVEEREAGVCPCCPPQGKPKRTPINVGRPEQLPLPRLFKLQPGGTCSRMRERARAGSMACTTFFPPDFLFFQPITACLFALLHGGDAVHPQSQTEATGHLPLTSDPGPLPSMQDAASQLHRPHEMGIHSLPAMG